MAVDLTIVSMKKYEYIATGGETSITTDLLIGKTILSVEKDGVGYTKIIITGTPTDKHVLYTNSTGTISFASELTAGEYILVLYEDNGNVCFPVAIQSGFTLPDAVAGFAYSASFYVSGSKDFSISSIVKPSWANVDAGSHFYFLSSLESIYFRLIIAAKDAISGRFRCTIEKIISGLILK